jgi:uncharacterized protein involved in exopolysaccharide biosynthesis
LDELGRQFGQNHPQYQSAAAELASLKERLQIEMQQVANSVGANNDVNVRRESEIIAALKSQKERVLALRAQRDEVAVMQRDIESAQRAYDLVNQRLSQTKLESQIQNTNIEVLTEAQAPRSPSSPKLVLYTAIGAAFGLLLGVSLAIGAESRRRPIRNASDVAELLKLPVLASLPHVGRDSSRKATLQSRHSIEDVRVPGN